MAEYIERESVMKAFADYVWNSNHSDLVPAPQWNHAVEIVRDTPAADVVEVRHGHFGKHTSPFTAPCSECGTSMNTHWQYCPNCGAKMDGGVNDAAD